ncbi:pyridoxamine 5'-phosphate oxidase family protein [Ureibacillus aquaedulcis]|uniref:Pyridoxamine 5'-phosphate oxidase family protein n=1 Tax=Ureibacillus aquaedulcis TaxID=3058421 RepID=A0ABT8GV54_9BACL|nr:pyridoxamine 5'-phosphate oxidase family protein [Ureibacillus sp. BA0131]MDN4495280.1 pyridoxamine 5'-phosphate oxidase family protein [Ureibacillus sp. BA0131]
MRGTVHNKKREVTEEEAYEFLKNAEVAHVATIGQDGYPYVIPFVYVYEGGSKLYIHIGNLRESHFWENVKVNQKVSIEVCEMRDVVPGIKYACQSALSYTSVVVFGTIKHIEEEAKKELFYDRLWKKYGDPNWKFEREGYPALPKTELFEIEIEKITGKFSEALSH